MVVYVLASDGLPIPHWEEYLPQTNVIYFEGERRQEEFLSNYAKKRNIPFFEQKPKNPETIFAFWNGTPDHVDRALCEYPLSLMHIFLPTEEGEGFEEYVSPFQHRVERHIQTPFQKGGFSLYHR